MANLPDSQKIEFLIERKFGAGARHADTVFPVSLSTGRGSRQNPELAKNVAEYRTKLKSLSLDELSALADSERRKQTAELTAKVEREERERFFSQPYSNADFDHWSRAAHWTLDEAIALSFGKAPERVNWQTIKPYVQVSAFAFQYQRRRDLAVRALAWKQLFDPVLPGFFLAWAKRTELDASPELESAVAARGILVADWKTLYDELQRQLKELQDSEARSSVGTAGLDTSLSTRERESLLKLVIGMAVGGYGYDSSASRSEQPADITTDLATNGVPLDVDTVRKWLKIAAELLPRNEAE